ncbi:MAG: FtsX-like permease family protein [Candidatus Theseobacter exili]|nr:FtsX-like permease family protein [Candidatus Theseobacter exili]
MVKILDRKLLRDLLRTKGLLIAVIMIVAVGTGSFVGMLSTYDNLLIARTSYYSRCRMADFWIDLKKAPISEIKNLETLKGISELRERISFPVIVDLENSNKPINGLALSMPAGPCSVINNIVMKSGSYFTNDIRDEVIVSDKFALARNIQPGSFINLILNGTKKKLYVAGTAISSEHIYLAPPGGIVDNPLGYGVFYLKREYMEDVFGFHGACNNIVGILTPKARYNSEQVLDNINKSLKDYGVYAATPLKLQFSNLTLSAEMGGLQTMATMFPAMFLSVAALVLNVLMTRITEQQRTIVGTLKALGINNMTIFNHFIKYGLFVGVTGGISGCILGHWIAAWMTVMYKTFFEFPNLLNELYPNTMLIAILISIVFSVIGTLRGVRRIIRLNPAEAMREPTPTSCENILLERWTRLWTNLDFRWQIILRSLFRNKSRTLIGIVAAAIGSSMVVLAFGFVNSMDEMIEFQFSKVMLSDYNLSLKDDLNYGAFIESKKLPGISHAEPIFNVPCTFINKNYHKKGMISGLISGAKLTIPRRANGDSVPIPPVGLLMTKRMAQHLDISEGQTVSFVPVRGERKTYEAKVVSIIDSMIGLSVYADFHYLNYLLGETSAVSDIQLKSNQTPEQKISFFKQLKTIPNIQSIDEIKVQKKIVTKQFTGAMQGTAFMMIMFAAVIFFGSILNGTLISIAERHREIATFRVLGYQAMEVGTIFLRENIVVNMIGTIAGLPLGYWLLVGMMSQFCNDAYSMPSVVYPSTWLWTIILAMLFVLGAHWIVQKDISKMDWSQALSMKE